MYTTSSPRKSISPIAAEADAFVWHYYGTTFGDTSDASRRAQTPFGAATASSTQQLADRHSHMAAHSPLLSSLPVPPPAWDGFDMGQAPSWVVDDPQYSVVDDILNDIPTPSYPMNYLPEYSLDTNYGISPSLVSFNYSYSELPYTTAVDSSIVDHPAPHAVAEQPVPSAMDTMPYDLVASVSSPAVFPASAIDTPSPVTPPVLYNSDMDAEGETDDEYTPDAEEEHLPTPKTRGTRRKPITRRSRSSLSPRARTTCLGSSRAPAVTAPRVVQADVPYTELTAEQVASRVCHVCGGSFRGEHGASDLKRHHACHFPDAGKWMCRGVAKGRARDYGLDPREAVMFQGELRCGDFCGKRFSRKDALLRHLKNSSEGCVNYL